MMQLKELDAAVTAFDKARLRLQAIAEADEQIARLEQQREDMAAAERVAVDGCADLMGAILQYERELIRVALRNAGGRISVAATALSVSHQALAYIISNRHTELLNERTPIQRRPRRNAKEQTT